MVIRNFTVIMLNTMALTTPSMDADYLANFLRSVIFLMFHHCEYTLPIEYHIIFGSFRRSTAVVTPVKHDCDSII